MRINAQYVGALGHGGVVQVDWNGLDKESAVRAVTVRPELDALPNEGRTKPFEFTVYGDWEAETVADLLRKAADMIAPNSN